MKIIDAKNIQLDRELSDLDQLVLRFVNIVEKHTPYVLVSGYIAILFGRSRGTEDVDLYINKLSFAEFLQLYQDICSHGFWALNANDPKELYSMLQDKLSIRFALKDQVIPNFEVKFVKDSLDAFTLAERIKVFLNGKELFIAPLDLQIAYKKFVLKSPKDLEDARYLQQLFEISEESINKFKRFLKDYGRL